LASTAACSASTPCSTHGERPTADEHPLPGEHEQDISWRAPLASEHEHHLLHGEHPVAGKHTSSRWGRESRLHDILPLPIALNGETKEREETQHVGSVVRARARQTPMVEHHCSNFTICLCITKYMLMPCIRTRFFGLNLSNKMLTREY
jgi:hypothetical protein